MRLMFRAAAYLAVVVSLQGLVCEIGAQTAKHRTEIPLGMSSQAWSFERDGWTYVHLEGTPREIGYQHGYMLKDAIEDNLQVYELENRHDLGKEWGCKSS